MVAHTHESFWQALTDTAYWQVFLALLVAYTTYYFTDRSRRKSKLAQAKSQAIRFGYELQQAYSNRLQSELKSNYYELASKFQKKETDRSFFLDIAKQEALSNPNQSLLISQIYGRLIENYGVIEQLGNSQDYNSIKDDIDRFVYNHGSITVKAPDENCDSIEKANKYNTDGHKDIEKAIDEKVKQANLKLKESLESVRLKLF